MFSPMINFKLFLSLSFLFALSSNSSFMLWISLEMNMLSFLPLMSFSGNKMLENTMKYFLIQSLASAMFLLSFLFSMLLMNNIFFLFMLTSMFIKLGSAPFHMWFISLMNSVNLWVLFFLSTFQKIIPMMVIFSISLSYFYLMIIIILNSLLVFSSSLILMGLNYILAFSSINNLSWMLLGLNNSIQVSMYYFLIYTFLLFGILVLYWNPSISILNQMNVYPYNYSMLILLTMFSLAGLPPFLGFLGKIMVLKQTLYFTNFIFLVIIVFSSLFILYLYMSFSYVCVLYTPDTKNHFVKKSLTFFKSLYMMTLLGFSLIMVFFM